MVMVITFLTSIRVSDNFDDFGAGCSAKNREIVQLLRLIQWLLHIKKTWIKKIGFGWRNRVLHFRDAQNFCDFQWKIGIHTPPPHAVSQTTILIS